MLNLFSKTCQCLIHVGQQQYQLHMWSSGYNYNTLVKCILWEVCTLQSNKCVSTTVRFGSNVSFSPLERNLEVDENDHRHIIHAEASSKKEIRRILQSSNIHPVFHKQEYRAQWLFIPVACPVITPGQISLVKDETPTHKYKELLRQLLAGLEYRQYLQKKYNLDKTWEWIDWLAF